MEVVIYAHPENRKKEELLQKIFQSVTSKSIMIFDFEKLSDLLTGKNSRQVILVSLIANEDDIGLLAARSSPLAPRHIIILPYNQKNLTQKALSLKPSYISYNGRGFDDVCAVLNKIRNQWSPPSKQNSTGIQ